MQLIGSSDNTKYFSYVENELASLYMIAKRARSRGIDPTFEPESHLSKDLAEMVEGLVGPSGVAERIRELTSQKIERHEMAFIIASDIIHAKFGHTDEESLATQAIRTSLAVMTGGITAAPIQGISRAQIKNNFDRTRYLAIYFAGPIRSAAGTEQALTLVIGDFIRKRLGLDSYKPTEDEIHRFIEEIRLYEREISRFQYHVSDEELEYALRNLPVEVTGTQTDPVEVSGYRNLPRIETNRVRAGALRIVNDGIVGRSQKVLRIIEALDIEGWDWLKKINEVNQTANDSADYMKDVIAGRPVFAFPSRIGGFRLRYGRSRNTGLAALGIHPATMGVLANFLASGTQIRIEGPGKGGIVVPVDSIEPPVVKLKNGSVVRVENLSQASQVQNDIKEILFLGDLLVSFGEFLENNKPLAASGYVEEWWVQDVRCALQRSFDGSIDIAAKTLALSINRLTKLIENPLSTKPTAQEALKLAAKLKTPIHPRFTYFWKDITFEELQFLRRALIDGETKIQDNNYIIELSSNTKLEDILERLMVTYESMGDKIAIRQDGLILASCLKIDDPKARMKKKTSTIGSVQDFSGLLIREKALTYIGARMGRPEKARPRKMSPLVHGLFPIGLAGGSRRDIVVAAHKNDTIQVEIVRRKCPECNNYTYKLICPICASQTNIERTCPRCSHIIPSGSCPVCKVPAVGFSKQQLNIGELYRSISRILGSASVKVVKGVRGLMSADKIPEALEKAILRAKHKVSVYKDGTVRFDATNAPLTHFKSEEIGLTVDELRRLGYNHDIIGAPLQNTSQICELKVQDIIIPLVCADYLLHVAQFIDELLVEVYKLPRHFNVKQRKDLIGHLIVGFAPHTSAGIVGRIIGFTEANVCYAHPLWHNTKRRDCDGDEDAVMLALDVLLNFSKSYLPSRIGGMMDAPLLLMSTIDPYEVDEARNMDVTSGYPLIFYEKTLEQADPKAISNVIDVVEHRLGTGAQFEGYCFTHHTFNINEGNLNSSYMKLGAMTNKIAAQLQLGEKIRAVDSRVVAQKVLTTHLIRDIAGNLSAFTKQKVRCKKCNAKYRRIPLSGKCLRCSGDLLPTVYRKGIEKYLDIADDCVREYDLDKYYRQRMALIRTEISSLFPDKTPERGEGKQVKLAEFM